MAVAQGWLWTPQNLIEIHVWEPVKIWLNANFHKIKISWGFWHFLLLGNSIVVSLVLLKVLQQWVGKVFSIFQDFFISDVAGMYVSVVFFDGLMWHHSSFYCISSIVYLIYILLIGLHPPFAARVLIYHMVLGSNNNIVGSPTFLFPCFVVDRQFNFFGFIYRFYVFFYDFS